MEMPKPSPGHKRFETLAGHWEGVETMYPSQWDPKGGQAQGQTKSRIALNGFAVVSDYEQRRGGVVTFAGHGVYTFDPKRELYTLHWFDCLGSPPEVFTGGFEGDVLTMAHEGPPMHVRLIYNFGEAGKLLSKLEMSPDGSVWNTLFDGVYTRR